VNQFTELAARMKWTLTDLVLFAAQWNYDRDSSGWRWQFDHLGVAWRPQCGRRLGEPDSVSTVFT
jgi:hypothetical protein